MCIRNRRRIVSSQQGKRTKNLSRTRLVIVRGRQIWSGKNCTKPAGALLICCKKSCKQSATKKRNFTVALCKVTQLLLDCACKEVIRGQSLFYQLLSTVHLSSMPTTMAFMFGRIFRK